METILASVGTSVVVAALVSALVAVLTSERTIAAENVIQERKKWRKEIRELASNVHIALSQPDEDERDNILRKLAAQFRFLLNPHDEMDQTILKLIAPCGRTRAEEFSDRVELLLKHDWERAKREASLWQCLYYRQPQRVKFETFTAGRAHIYRESRWSVEMTRKRLGKILDFIAYLVPIAAAMYWFPRTIDEIGPMPWGFILTLFIAVVIVVVAAFLKE